MPQLRFSEHVIGDGPKFREHACRLGLEGAVSKRIDRSYAPGDRAIWVKSKCLNREESVGRTRPADVRTSARYFLATTPTMARCDTPAESAPASRSPTGAVTLAIGQIAFAIVRPPVLRAVIAAAFAIPAAIAGYHAVLGLSQVGVPSLIWHDVFAWIGALFIGGTAWARMTVFAEPLPLRPGGASPNNSQPVLTGATRQS